MASLACKSAPSEVAVSPQKPKRPRPRVRVRPTGNDMCSGVGASADRGPCDQYLMKRGLQTDSWSDDRNGSAGNTGGASATNGAASGTGWAGAQAEGLVLKWGRDPEAFETLWDYKLGA